ncbi:MAG: hypothetical protein HOH74_04840, partial [Gemmatimonadetes bacterium]|nr:hypothetical protein [Gemmatimonadota bacterium]
QPHRGALSLGADEVAAYFRALTQDVLASFKPSVVWMESLYRHPMALPSKSRAPLTPRCQLLLSLDWNPGMLAKAETAGIPATHLREEVANWLQIHLARMPTTEDAQVVDDDWLETAFDGALAAYLGICREVTTSLWEEIVALIHDAGSRTYHQPVGDNSLGTDLDARVNAQIDRVMMSPENPADADVARRRYRSPTEIFVPLHGQYDSRQALMDDVAAARSTGADGVSFYAYGLLRDEQLSWMADAKQA